MLLSVFFYCICAFLCAVAVSNYPFVVKAMSLVGFPPKRPFPPHQIVSVLAKRGDIFGRRDLVISAGPIVTLDCYEGLGAKLAEFYSSICP